jgi:transcriptional regulator with XRE-family HTH domain/tetratricopeptide (TPR) repeat protein
MPPMSDVISFGDWVRRRRKALDLTQEQLASLVGCSHSAIRKFETDERRPSIQIAELLATHLEISDGQRTLFLKVARGAAMVDRLSVSSSGLEFASTHHSFIPPTNLPASPTPFIGREQDVKTLTKMLDDPHCRLITLLGQGGMGKTRLSIHVAAQSMELFEGRVYFVQLAPLTSVDAILPAIASIFGLIAPNTDLKLRLVGYLREKSILLVLDNFEHLVQGSDLLTELLQQSPRLKLLVTSRERLNLQGEWTLELSGLTLPPETQSTVGEYDALELFEQSAKRARPDIKFTEKDYAAAIRICNLVEGLPLAIELAAAWINLLSCEEIAREIEKTFDFLKSSQRNIPERHKSLRAAFEHSWQLLTDEERSVLANLSIFRGGYSRETAETITGASLEILSSLLVKSLIRRVENGRFDMHEAIRQFASEYLVDQDAVRESHGNFFLTLLANSDEALKSGGQIEAINKITEEFGNIQSAWEWGLENDAFQLMQSTLPAMWLSYDVRGWLNAGFTQTDVLIQKLRPLAEKPKHRVALGLVLAFHGMFCFRLGDYARAKVTLDESLSIVRPLNIPDAMKPVLIFNGIVTSLMGDVSTAQDYMNEGVALASETGDPWFLALGQFNQGFQLGLQGKRESAYDLMHAGLLLWREMGNIRFTGMALNFISPIAIELNLRGEARSYLDESLRLTSSVEDRWGMGTAMGRLGLLDLLEGDLSSAEAQLGQSIAIFTELGARWDLAWAMMQLGKVQVRKAELQLGSETLGESLDLAKEANAAPLEMEASVELAKCLIELGEKDDAARLAKLVLENPLTPESVREQAGQILNLS